MHRTSLLRSRRKIKSEENLAKAKLRKQMKTSSKKKTNTIFICTLCKKKFSSKKELGCHQKSCFDYTPKINKKSETEVIEIEKERRAYRVPRQCKKCPQVFMTVKELKNHQKEHSSLEPIEEHIYVHDASSNLYICQTCSAEFDNTAEAEEHLKIHIQSFGCMKCSDKFKTLRALFCHMENHPEGDKIPCPMCSFKTTKKNKLLYHLSSSHLKTNVCTKCGKVFNSRSNLRKHTLRHDETMKHACIVCSNVYFGEKALLRHQVCMHKADIISDPSLLWCHICRIKFKTLNLLKYHIEKAHTKTSNNRTVEKKCLCDICGQGFKDADNLKKHKISHTEDRPFMCFQCGKAFKHKYVLTYHQRIHTGERPYNCGYCGKSFRQWTPYKVHLRGHTGEKPYVCKICSKGFTTNQALKLHLKSCFDRDNTGIFESVCVKEDIPTD